jgi:hypothetical protein
MKKVKLYEMRRIPKCKLPVFKHRFTAAIPRHNGAKTYLKLHFSYSLISIRQLHIFFN